MELLTPLPERGSSIQPILAMVRPALHVDMQDQPLNPTRWHNSPQDKGPIHPTDVLLENQLQILSSKCDPWFPTMFRCCVICLQKPRPAMVLWSTCASKLHRALRVRRVSARSAPGREHNASFCSTRIIRLFAYALTTASYAKTRKPDMEFRVLNSRTLRTRDSLIVVIAALSPPVFKVNRKGLSTSMLAYIHTSGHSTTNYSPWADKHVLVGTSSTPLYLLHPKKNQPLSPFPSYSISLPSPGEREPERKDPTRSSCLGLD